MDNPSNLNPYGHTRNTTQTRTSRRNPPAISIHPPTIKARRTAEPQYYHPSGGVLDWDPDDPPDVDAALRRREYSSSRRTNGGASFEDGFFSGLNKLSRAATKRRSGRRSTKRYHGAAPGELGGEGTAPVQPSSFHLAVPGAKRPSVRSQHTQGQGPSVASNHAPEVDDSFFLHDGRATTVPQNLLLPTRIKSPELVDLKRSSNYLAMDPRSSTPPVPSISSYVSRLHQFFKDLKDLPWSSSRPTADYYPGQSKGRYHLDKYFEKDWDAPSWYALLHRQYIDLLSSESSETASLPHTGDIAYQPTLAYEAPTGEGQTYTFPQGQNYPTYPYSYVPQPFIIEPQNGRHAQSNSFQMYGPPVPGHMSGNQYPYPTWHWRPPPRTS